MPNIFFISDLHLGHEKTCTTFKRPDGSPLRPFKHADEMNGEIMKRWNTTVGPQDKVYVLGDVVINQKYLPLMDALNGSKRLVRGNHDIFKIKDYLLYFKEVYGVRVLEDVILTHIPIHRDSIVPRFGTNVHGHLHDKEIPDGAYFNVSVEQIDYTPISYDDLRVRIKAKQERYPNLTYGCRPAKKKDGERNVSTMEDSSTPD